MKLKSSEYPKGHLLNPETRYVSASATNVAETFKRVRKEMQAKEKPAAVNVAPIRKVLP